MTETEARAVLRLRALESAPNASWTDADAAWADREARREEGEGAAFERWLARRTVLASRRLGARATGALRAVADGDSAAGPAASGMSPWFGALVVVAAFALGVAGDAASGTQRIHLLAPPLLALLAWNVAIYPVLLLQTVAGSRARASFGGPLRRWLHALAASGADGWAVAGAPLHAARSAALLHAAAFAIALGALVSLYLRGIAFEFRAGWDSTFLTAADVHAIVATVLGPASRLSGLALPGVAELDALRFAHGPGENAARWIHLHAITTALVVLLPRALLALASAWRARRLARDFPLALDDDYFVQLRRRWAAEPVVVRVLPYSYVLTAQRRDRLRPVLEREVGPLAVPQLAATVPHGGEDDLAAWFDAPGALGAPGAPGTSGESGAPGASGASGASMPPVLCALFPLTATPERENHGAFVHALGARAGARPGGLVVLVDESGFRERFNGPDFERRRAERRQAWEAMLGDVHRAAVFVDLDAADGSAAPPAPASA
jgi:hypothetical protein